MPNARLNIQLGADEDDIPAINERLGDFVSPVRMRNRRRFSEVGSPLFLTSVV